MTSIKISAKTKWALISVVIGILILLFFYHVNIFHPNKFIFLADVDGLKTYFNFVWHGMHDSSLLELNSMNYPNGEFLLLEDSIPFLNNCKMLLSHFLPAINNYSVAILNLLVFFAFPVGVFFMYLIFLRFSLPYHISAFGAIVVIFLSSQILLLNPAGHLALCSVCFFPIGWYLVLRYFDEQNPVKWSILIALNILIWTFTHVYLGFLLIIFTTVVFLTKLLFRFRYFFQIKVFVHFLIQVVIPTVFTFGLIKMFDSHPDRIDMPFMTTHSASFYTVFLSNLSPIKGFYNLFFDLSIIDKQSWGRIGNYIGFVSNIVIIATIVMSIIFLVKRKLKNIKAYFPNELYIYILASISLLIYSMAIPVKYFSESFINSMPLLKQFSSMGRFAWGFYYVIVVYSLVFLYKLLYKSKWGKVLFYLLLIFYFVEAVPYHNKVSKKIKVYNNAFSLNHISNSEKVLTELDKEIFQAILPIPYYLKFNLPFSNVHSDNSIYASMISAVHTGLPIFSVYLSRPSVTEGLSIFKMLQPLPYRVSIPEIVNDKRNFAVIVNVADSTQLSTEERLIISKAHFYKKSEKYIIYSLSPDTLFEDYSNEKDKFELIKDSLVNKNMCLVQDTSSYFYYQNFDEQDSSISYKGKGSFKREKNKYNIVCELLTNKLDTSKNYVLSYWYYNYLWDQTFNTAIIEEIDNNKEVLQYLYYSPIATSIIDKWWYFSEYQFKPISNESTIKIFFHGTNKFENWFAIDELLLRPADADIYRIEECNGDSIIYKNNKKLY